MKFLPSWPMQMPKAAVVFLGCVFSLGVFGCSTAWAKSAKSSEDTRPDATALVGEMTVALKELNYEGTFVHVQGANVTSMHILHASDVHGEMERLVSLDGEAREVIRNNALVTCIWPGTESVIVSKSKPRDLLPQIDASLTSGNRYAFILEELLNRYCLQIFSTQKVYRPTGSMFCLQSVS